MVSAIDCSALIAVAFTVAVALASTASGPCGPTHLGFHEVAQSFAALALLAGWPGVALFVMACLANAMLVVVVGNGRRLRSEAIGLQRRRCCAVLSLSARCECVGSPPCCHLR